MRERRLQPPQSRPGKAEICHPYACATLLFEDRHRPLMRAFDSGIPWIDDIWDDVFQFGVLGSPQDSGKRFVEFMQSEGSPANQLDASWRDAVGRRSSEVSAEQHAMVELADLLGISRDRLPCVVISSLGKDKYHVVEIPSQLAESELGAKRIIGVLEESLSQSFISRLASMKDAKAVGRCVSRVAIKMEMALNPAGRGAGNNPLGRPHRYDGKADQRVLHIWHSGQYRTKADLARALGMETVDVGRAIDRARKRLGSSG